MAAPVAVRAAAWHMPERIVKDPGPEDLGIEQIRADDSMNVVGLAVPAAARALSDAGLSPLDLDAVIAVESRVPEAFMTSETTRMQAMIGARRAVAFSVGGVGCVSITPALLAARGLLAADADMHNVLVLHGSKPAAPDRYRHPVTVNGDCGQALVMSRQGPVRVLDILQESNGEYWDLFRVDYRDRPWDQWREACADTTRYSFRLALETRDRLRKMYRHVLERNGMRPQDVTCHFSHNLSVSASQFTEESLGISLDPACAGNLRNYGHLGPIDVLLNLYTAIEDGRLADGQRAVLLNASPVAAWSLLLIEIGDEDTAHCL